MPMLTRRNLLSGSAALASIGLAGCTTTATSGRVSPSAQLAVPAVPAVQTTSYAIVDGPINPSDYGMIYGQLDSEPFPVAKIDIKKFDPQFLRQDVTYTGSELPGTIVIDPDNHFLYHVEDGGRARRYGVGVGKQGFAWSGAASINSKQEWPDWYPPKEMIDRRPDIEKQLSELQGGLGVKGGPGNPLGARAMYLWQNNKDTLYRIHGTVEPYTIGKSVSSGCIRMMNQDVIDLYSRTAEGTKVVVLGDLVPYASTPMPSTQPAVAAKKRRVAKA